MGLWLYKFHTYTNYTYPDTRHDKFVYVNQLTNKKCVRNYSEFCNRQASWKTITRVIDIYVRVHLEKNLFQKLVVTTVTTFILVLQDSKYQQSQRAGGDIQYLFSQSFSDSCKFTIHIAVIHHMSLEIVLGYVCDMVEISRKK